MKRRPPPRPPVVEVRPRKRLAAPAPVAPPRPLPPDRGRIQAMRDGEPDHKERERLGRMSATDRWHEGMEYWKARHSRPNDPQVFEDAARVGVGHAMIEATMGNWVAVESELPHLRIYPHRDPRREHWGLLKQAWARLYPNTTSGVSDPRGHGPSARWSWPAFLRGLRGKKE